MPNIPPTIAILAGEVVYNLRAALDYLAVSLAELDSPNPTTRRRNQFPIESTPKRFTDRRGTFLAGISDRHVKTIERFQPYRRGNRWIADLAMLSNLDKHNRIVDVHKGSS